MTAMGLRNRWMGNRVRSVSGHQAEQESPPLLVTTPFHVIAWRIRQIVLPPLLAIVIALILLSVTGPAAASGPLGGA